MISASERAQAQSDVCIVDRTRRYTDGVAFTQRYTLASLYGLPCTTRGYRLRWTSLPLHVRYIEVTNFCVIVPRLMWYRMKIGSAEGCFEPIRILNDEALRVKLHVIPPE